MSRLQLSYAGHLSDRVQDLYYGAVRPEAIDLQFLPLQPFQAFKRMLDGEFHCGELSFSTWVLRCAKAKAEGKEQPFVAIPAFPSRTFRHNAIYVNTKAGIKKPEDLRGKRVGVPEYQQTAAVWSRWALQHEFGVKPSDITWFMERTPEVSHGGATGFTAPPGVTVNRIPQSTNIGEMLMNGELDATVIYLTDKNLVDRSRIDLIGSGKVRRLFPDQLAEGQRLFKKTGIYPINHCVVVRRKLLEQHPWIALNLYKAFVAAKEMGTAQMAASLEPYLATGAIGAGVTAKAGSDALGAGFKAAIDADPLAYGFKASKKVLDTIVASNHEQGLVKDPVKLEDLFWPSTLDL